MTEPEFFPHNEYCREEVREKEASGKGKSGLFEKKYKEIDVVWLVHLEGTTWIYDLQLQLTYPYLRGRP